MRLLIYGALAALLVAPATAAAGEGFDVVALGARGGIQDGNLSAFMIAPHGDKRARHLRRRRPGQWPTRC